MDEDVDLKYIISGYSLRVKTLDLNQPWQSIRMILFWDCSRDQAIINSGKGKPMRPRVYFLVMFDPRDYRKDLGMVKVGITRGDVERRLLSLQTGNPYDLICFDSFETPWAKEVEHLIHRTHAKEMHKNEWLVWPRSNLASLVAEAKDAARRIDERKSKEFDATPTGYRMGIRDELVMKRRSFCTFLPERYKRS